jgi:hypothetical protein
VEEPDFPEKVAGSDQGNDNIGLLGLVRNFEGSRFDIIKAIGRIPGGDQADTLFTRHGFGENQDRFDITRFKGFIHDQPSFSNTSDAGTGLSPPGPPLGETPPVAGTRGRILDEA